MESVVKAPVLTAAQAQGDLLILPWGVTEKGRASRAYKGDPAGGRRAEDTQQAKPIKAAHVVLTGADGHSHTLHPAEGVAWFGYGEGSQTLGVLTVAADAVAVLGHVEHGESRIGPGVYVIRRQRQQLDRIELVAD